MNVNHINIGSFYLNIILLFDKGSIKADIVPKNQSWHLALISNSTGFTAACFQWNEIIKAQ